MKNFTLCGACPHCKFSALRKFLLTVLLCLGINLVNAAPVSAVVVTAPTNGENICSATATGGAQPAYTTLNAITIAETNATDFETGATILTLNAPSGWHFNTASAITVVPTGADITLITTAVTATTLVVTVNISAGLTVDNFTISGLQVQANSTSSSAGSITANKSPGGNFNGLNGGTSLANLSLTASPVLTGPSSGAACTGGTLNLSSSATGSGTIHYLWNGPSLSNSSVQNPSISSVTTASGGTYSLTVTDDATSCTASGTTIAIVNTTPASISGGNFSICQNAQVTLNVLPAGSAAGGTWSSTVPAVGSIGSASGIFLGLSSTIATTTVNFASVCGTVNAVATVNPSPAIITGTTNVCAGSVIALTDATAGGTWSSTAAGNASVDGSGNVNGLISNTTTNIQYTLTGGCFATHTVSVNSLPNLSASIPNNPVCVNAALSFSATATNGTGTSGGISFLWSGPVALGAVATPSVTASLAANGTYTVKATDSKSCFQTATVVATVNPIPTAISGTNAVCFNSSITLSDADALGTWSSSNANVSLNGIGTQTVTVTGATGNTTSTISYSFATGCRVTQVVSINSLPVISSVSTGGAVCAGSTLTFSTTAANGAGTSGALSYAWNGPTALNAIATPSVTSVTTTSDGQYTVTVTDSKTCSSQASVIATVNALPTLTDVTLSATTLCVGNPLTLTANGASGASSQLRYNWSGPAGFTASTGSGINTQTHSVTATSASGNYSVTVTYFGIGCTSTPVSTSSLLVNPTPAVNVSGKSICSNTSTNLTLGATIPSNFNWTIGTNPDGVTTPVGGSGSVISQTLVNPLNNAPAVVEYIVTPTGDGTLGTCIGNPTSLFVTVNPTPIITSTTTVTTCGNVNVPLSASISSNFTWTKGASTLVSGAHSGTGGPGAFLTDNLTNTDPTNTTFGTQVYSITPTTTVGGCVGVTSVMIVTVNPGSSITGVTNTSICSGGTFTFAVTPSVTPSTIAWTGSVASGSVGIATVSGTSNPINAGILTNNSSTTPAVVVFTVTASSSGGGCSGTDGHVTVTVNPAPNVTGATSTAVCSGAGLSFPITTSTGGTISWVPGVGTGSVTGLPAANTTNPITATSSLINSDPNHFANGTVIFTVTPTSALGCDGPAAQVTVTVYPTPVMTSTASVTTCSAVSIPLNASTTGANTFSYIAASIGTPTVTGFNNSTITSGSIVQTLINLSNSAVGVVIYSVTPTSAIGSCVGPLSTITVSVNPSPGLNSSSLTGTSCSDLLFNILLSSTSGLSTFTWGFSSVTSGTITPVASSGGTSSITATLHNTSNSVNAVVVYTVIPTTSGGGGCSSGNPISVTVTVYPTPVMTPTAIATCSNISPAFTLGSSTDAAGSGTGSYNWTIGTITGGINGSSSAGGLTLNQTLTAPAGNTTAGTVPYLVTPTSSQGCVGSATTIIVSVNPIPVMTPTSVATCNGVALAFLLTTNPVIPSHYSWTTGVVTGTVTGASDVGDSIINQTLRNNDHYNDAQINYSVTPTSKDGHCVGSVAVVNVAVHPSPVVTGTSGGASSVSVCSNTPLNIPLFATATSSFSWTVGTITGSISGATAGSDPAVLSNTLLDPSNSAPGTVAYNVIATSTAGSCPSDPFTMTAIVNPSPVLGNSSSASVCSDVALNIALNASVLSSFSWGAVSTTGGITGTGSGSSFTSTIDDILTNPSNTTPGSVVYTVLPTSTTGSCVAQTIATINVVVNPTPTITSSLTYTVCSGLAPAISLVPSTPSTFVSTVGAVTGGITGASGSSSAVISQVLTNPSNSAVGTQVYLVTPTSITGSCAPTSPTAITVSVDPAPMISSATTGSICSGQRPDVNAALAYTLTATTGPDATFVWNTVSTSSGAITDHLHSPSSGSSIITDTVDNSSNTTVGTITYSVIPTSGLGCVGPMSSITITVNPLPKVTDSSSAICSKADPAVNLVSITTIPSIYSWSVAATSLAIPAGTSGFTSVIHDVLTNAGNSRVGIVVFTVTPTSADAGCIGFPSLFTVSVNPIPKLRSLASEAICSESRFDYHALSSTDTAGTTSFAWNVSLSNGNTVSPNTSGNDTTGHISDTVSSNHIIDQNTITFSYSLTSRGCSSDTDVVLTVNPRPVAPVITASTPSSICSNTMFQNFGANIPSDTSRVHYHWSAGPDAVIFDTSTTGINRNILVNFPTAGLETIKVIAYVDTFVGCVSSAQSIVNVTASVADDPARVVYHNHMFICLKNNVDTFGFQWGFDEAGTLIADTLKNEVNQNYYNATPDTFNKYYWVIAKRAECPQKSYYNSPKNTIRGTLPPTEEVGIKIYPNPATSDITIEFGDISGGEFTADIFDITGRKMATLPIKDLITKISVKDLSTGCYIIECRKNGIKVSISRFIKN